ncbi:transposase [Streptomyces tendae]|uniref:transposase n=1 Tax=Streptomyces tendae TaxID=1932 RepID=UPI0037AA71A9
MTSEDVAEDEVGETVAAVLAKAVDGRLVGEGGLLQRPTKWLLESALEGEIIDHLGCDKRASAGKNGGNSRNGTCSRTVLTDFGPVEATVPRNRDGSFELKIVVKLLTCMDACMAGSVILSVGAGVHLSARLTERALLGSTGEPGTQFGRGRVVTVTTEPHLKQRAQGICRVLLGQHERVLWSGIIQQPLRAQHPQSRPWLVAPEGSAEG